MRLFEKKYYLCGTCGKIYNKSEIPEIRKSRKSKTPRCCKKPLQVITKDVKKEIEGNK